MKRPLPFRTERRRIGGALTLGALLAGCATTVQPTDDALAPLDLALTGELPVIAQKAKQGDAHAQFALSIITAYGLRGHPVNPSTSAVWLSRAMDQRRVMPVTQYTAAFNGQPSRVNIIHVPVAVLAPAQVAVVEACVAALSRADPALASCGDTDRRRESRRTAWAVGAAGDTEATPPGETR